VLDIKLQSIFAYFTTNWKMGNEQVPQIILSIQGSATWSKLDDQQMCGIKTFEDSLYEIAANTDSWIFSDANKGSIGRIVGTSRYKHMQEHKNSVPVIGITSDRAKTSQKDSIEVEQKMEDLYDLSHEFLVIVKDCNYGTNQGKKAKWFRKHLEYYANGTYALVSEDDTIPDTGLKWLTSYAGEEISLHVPLVYIYIGGTWSDIYAINEHLSNHLAIIFIRNFASKETRQKKGVQYTESLVDMLVTGIEQYRKNSEKMFEENAAKKVVSSLITRPFMRQAILSEVSKLYDNGEGNRETVTRVKHIFQNHLKRLLLKSGNIKIVNPDKSDLTNAITTVVEIGVEQRSLMPKFSLGYLQAAIALWQYSGCNIRQKLTLGRADLAQKNTKGIMWHALVNCKKVARVDWIKIMTEEVYASYGYAKLLEFLTPVILMKLFEHDFREIYSYRDPEFREFFQDCPIKRNVKKIDVENFVVLLKAVKSKMVLEGHTHMSRVSDILDIHPPPADTVIGRRALDTDYQWVNIEGAHQGLMLWAVLTEKEDIVEYLWRKSRMSIPTALAIASICHSIVKSKDIEEDTRTDFARYRLKYEQRAVDIFNDAWDKDWQKAELLLGYPHREWANFTCFDLAETAGSHGFFAHPGVWSALHNVWSEKHITGIRLKIAVSSKHVFYINWLSHITFNMLFMYLLMASMCIHVALVEYLLLFWMVMFALEEVRQIHIDSADSAINRLKGWWASPWNKSDSMIIVAYFTGFILHHVNSVMAKPNQGDRVYSVFRNSTTDQCPLQLTPVLFTVQVKLNNKLLPEMILYLSSYTLLVLLFQ